MLRRLRQVRHAVPMLSIRTETDTRPAAPRNFDARVRRELGLGRDAIRRSNTSAELKFDGLAINLRYEDGVLVAGRDARRRRDRRGRDARTCARSAQIPLRLQGMRRRGARGARRGLHAARRLRGAERAPAREDRAGREEREDLRQPAQRRRRRGAPARPGDRRAAAAAASSPTASARSQGWDVPPTQTRAARRARRDRACRSTPSARVVARAPTGWSRSTRAIARAARRAAVRHRRRRLQGQRASRCSSSSASCRASRAGRSRTSTRRRSR